MIPPTTSAPRSLRVAAAFLLMTVAGQAASPILAQSGGPGTGGATRLEQTRRYLDQHHRVLVIGAHPDDEDTELITILSRGHGIQTAYLSLTRGEGGQNLIGGELGPALGIVRSEELLAARRVDGARQFFTRAYDFGFSKSAEEAFRFWPRDSLLKDVVRVIRRFRPDVIVSVWSGTPSDGHGHHQASGIIARAAFDAAQDSTRFPELAQEEGLAYWQPSKFYRDYRATGPGVTFDGGELDGATGQSYHQLAARSRSQHRSQGMGQLQEPGPSARRIVLEATSRDIRTGGDSALFAGIAPGDTADPERRAVLALAQAGVVLDAYTGDAEVTPGQQVPVTLLAWNAGTAVVTATFGIVPKPGFVVSDPEHCGTARAVGPGAVESCTLRLEVEQGAPVGQPYYLVQPRSAGQYHWSGARTSWGLPFDPPLAADIAVTIAGRSYAERLPIKARSLDRSLGEVRRPVTIVPRVIVGISPGHVLWPASVAQRRFTVSVEHASPDSLDAVVGLTLPAGWRTSSPVPVSLLREGERRVFEFVVTRPTGTTSGDATISAYAAIGHDTLSRSVTRIAYPHINPHLLFGDASASVVVAPVVFPERLRIGYIRGAADAIPEALEAAGVAFRLLDPADLGGHLLDSLDVVVVGPRAYEVDPALGRANPRLLDFARAGGTLIVQYQQYQYVRAGFAPLPLAIARPHDRVTDERAVVKWLDGSGALQRWPNQLSSADWDNWVQERGLYFAHTWDAGWTPLLEMADPDESVQRGALLVARYGSGTVVYTGLAFFRQLPAAVPGAWRLFANLLAIGQGE